MTPVINTTRPLHLFDGYGIELEYMVVDRGSLNVLPVVDKVLEQAAGRIVNEISHGSTAWSNELALHVIEIKTDGAVRALDGAGALLQQQVGEINNLLMPMNACLMPGSLHPWMDPFNELKLWPHEYNPVYAAFNRIFDCRGHGWANLQSTHLNLPFDGDEEFAKLHAALRLVLPLIPAMAASSPLADGEQKPYLDYRMETYRGNSLRIPSITGLIVPERVFSAATYRKQILEKIYADIRPHDPDGILQEEWMNARGLMARWDRCAIEVRVIDIQENPAADCAILEWIVELTRALVAGEWCDLATQMKFPEQDLYHILLDTICYGEHAGIGNQAYRALFGVEKNAMNAGGLCRHIFEKLSATHHFTAESRSHLELIFAEGSLSGRILKALPLHFSREDLFKVYERLCECLRDAHAFVP